MIDEPTGSVSLGVEDDDHIPHENVETCELCGVNIPDVHPHLVDTEERRLLCACEACAGSVAGDNRYRRIPLEQAVGWFYKAPSRSR